MKKKYSLTAEHKELLKTYKDKWIANALACDPMTDADKEEARAEVVKLYAAANLPPPKAIIFVPSPLVLRFASGFASFILSQKRDATDAATDAATRVATLAATRAATDYATLVATHAATLAATDDATRAATHAATLAATNAARRPLSDPSACLSHWYVGHELLHILAMKLFGEKSSEALRAVEEAYSTMWQGGNQWSGWLAYLSFFQDVAKLDLPEYARFAPYRRLGEISGPRAVHADFCMISDRPEYIKLDNQGRPHCTTGPFCRWRDGFSLYALNGVHVPAKYIEREINPEELLKEPSAEIRMTVLRNMRGGFDKLVRALKGKKISTTPSTRGSSKPVELWEVQMPDFTEKIGLLKVTWHDTVTEQETFLAVPRSKEGFADLFGIVPTNVDDAELVRLATMRIDTSKYDLVKES